MNQDALVDALKSQLDLAEQIVNWALVFAAAVAWAGLQRDREIEAFHVKVDRRDAFVAVSVLYLFATMTLCVLFLRTGDLLELLDKTHFDKGITVVATHRWILNPFSYFGPSFIARTHASEGYGALIAIWWLCNSSLYTLIDDKRSRRFKILLGIFLGVGLLAMQCILRVYMVVLAQAKIFNTTLYRELMDTTLERSIATFLGIAAGGLIFTATNWLQVRRMNREDASMTVETGLS